MARGKALTLPGSGEGSIACSPRRTQKWLHAPAAPPLTPKGGSTAFSASTDSRLPATWMRTSRVSPRPPRQRPGPPESSRSAVRSMRTG